MTRVAIIGGGCAGLAAAFELTKPMHCGAFEVTVYQMGWRLGGKGASGRGSSGRIEEHGLHLWMGFYENAFGLMRECYAELGRDPRACPIARWEDAFEPAPLVAVTERSPGGDWSPWIASFPPGRGTPGDGLRDHNPFTVQAYLVQAASLVGELLRSAHAVAPGRQGRGGDGARGHAGGGPERAVEAVDAVLRYGRLATIAAIFEATDVLRVALEALTPRDHRDGDTPLLRLVDAIADAARHHIEALASGDPELRRTWQVADLVLAIIRGSLRFGLALHPDGFDAIDGYEWREWLALNGASERSLSSGFVRGIYDLAFAFEGGDPRRPRLSAAVALRGAMRMFFTYRGALFWRMTAGMGDIVFAPLYEVLVRRGVRFEFFHRLRDVRLDPAEAGEKPSVAALEFDVQARTAGGAPYRPLVDVGGLPCWPAQPLFEQLEGGAAIEAEGRELESPWDPRVTDTRTLRAAEDFDLAVLALGLGAVPMVCSELVARDERWRDMVSRVKSVPTQAFQVWMREDMRALGWRPSPVNLSGFVEPFDTWADMTHLLEREAWQTRVRSVAYFCSVLPDVPVPEGVDPEGHRDAQTARVRENAIRFLDRDIASLWPRAAADDGGFRWELLAAEGVCGPGEQRFDSQFWTANVRPSDRYVQSLPGTQAFRLSPLDAGVDNMTVAGDWTESGLNSGCVESAVMSGMLAAHAVSRSPALGDIIGYDHP